jgi:FkbM family methyltransferase
MRTARRYLSRPDVRQAPVRLTARRLLVAALERVRPQLLAADRTFRLSNGLRVRAPLSDSVGRELFVHGSYDWSSVQAWEAAIRPGDTVVDVGAHFGTFTLSAARKVGWAGRVIAFEPNPATRERLVTNIGLNGFADRVTVLPFALIDHDGGEISIGSPDPANSGMSRLGLGDVMVACRTLDSALAEASVNRVAAVKIDVEGAERAVLDGAVATLASSPVVLMEVNGTAGTDALTAAGYRLSLPGGESVEGDVEHLRRRGEALNVVARRQPAIEARQS